MTDAPEQRPIRMLMVEDDQRDAAFMIRQLRCEGYVPECTVVDTEEKFRRQLSANLDLVLSDMSLPQFSGLRALEILRESQLDIPFILVSGTLSDSEALLACRQGASDYLLKDRMARLGPAVRQVLQDHQIRQQRRREEVRFRAIVENAPVGLVWLAPNGDVQEANPMAHSILDVAEPGGRTDNINELIELPQPLHPLRGEYPLVKSPTRWVELHLVAVENGCWLAYLQDVTERRRHASELTLLDTLFHQLAANMGDVLWVSDIKQSQTIYISPSYEAVWGRSCRSAYENPKDWVEAIHPEDRALIQKRMDALERGQAWEEIYRIVSPDGATRWIHDRAFHLRDAIGNPYLVAGLARDITEKKKLEEQLLRAQKMEAIGTLAGGVAHDFNNLLTVIGGHASFLAEDPDELEEHQEQILQAVARAADLTRQLLLFSRRHPVRLVPVNLGSVIGNVTRMLTRVLGEDITLTTELEPGLPPIQGEVGMLEQVLMNLSVNARDALPQGGRLTISLRQATDGCLELLVSDNGCGVAPENLPHLFEPFFTTKEAGKGTGLGLATVYGIVLNHRGTVSVRSELGQGTEFLLRFPPSEEPARPADAPADDRLVPGKGTILLVEDSPELLGLGAGILRRCGYNVITAASGDDALEIWQKHKGEIDLLFSDVVMPGGLSGAALAKRLRKERPDLRVLLCSGYPNRGNLDESLGATPFLAKPYSPADLSHRVGQLLAGPVLY